MENRLALARNGRRDQAHNAGVSPIIRPMPRFWFRGPFVLCDGKRCRGKKCTYAHSVEERDAWNRQKFAVKRRRPTVRASNGGAAPPRAQAQPYPIHRIRPMPSVFFRGPFVLCDGRVQCRGERCTYPHSNEERDAWNAQKFGRHQVNPPFSPPAPTARPPQPTHPRAPTQSSPQKFAGEYPPLSPLTAKPPQPIYQSVSAQVRQGHPLGPPEHSLPAQVRQGHPLGPPEHSLPAQVRQGHPLGPPEHSLPVQVRQGHPLGPPEHSLPAHEQQSHYPSPYVAPSSPPDVVSQTKSSQRPLRLADIKQNLTRESYKTKFSSLLDWEEGEHSIILKANCDGRYTLMLHQAHSKPPWLKFDAQPFHQRFGYLLGLDGNQVAYATQASEGAFLIAANDAKIKASIMRENFHHIEERLYIAFSRESLEGLEMHLKVSRSPCEIRAVDVQFELKHSYFSILHLSVKQLPEKVIRRLMPDANHFEATNLPLQQVFSLSQMGYPDDQLQALQAIASCSPSGPPVLIVGPFGTGKTRILATAVAQYFFQESSIRVLVCTQQQVSADTFLTLYLDLLPDNEDLYIVRLTTEYGHRNPDLRGFYKTISQFKGDFDRSSHSDYLIIATCTSSRQLADTVPPGFFTHILIDEGAQMREPEAVAPLRLAGERTKIVIAGDQHQVGPAMLVLGEKPQKNGLAVSLLERLHNRYIELGEIAKGHHATLVTNYRCHSGILRLPENLYNLPMKCVVDPNSTHPRSPFPLRFVCSSIDTETQHVESSINEGEARITLNQVVQYASDWPAYWGLKDLTQFCFISPTRSQVTSVAVLLKKLRLPHKLKNVRLLPTYVIQGHEFRAVFISTAEPTWEDGDTRNPIKSICDRYVFNTVITRAQSLVVSVGNPFLLLKMEEHMIQKYGSKGRCWSEYLKLCLEHDTLSIDPSLGKSIAEVRQMKEQLAKSLQQTPHYKASNLPFVTEDTQHSELGIKAEGKSSPTKAEKQLELHTLEGKSSPTKAEKQLELHTPEGKSSPTKAEKQLELHTLEGKSSPTKAEKQLELHTPEGKSSPIKAEKQLELHTSRLEEEFTVIGRLGEGGQGDVYRVSKKLDSQQYAVKIIELIGTNHEKMRREVEALAKSDHSHIVRYYHSWIEEAPKWFQFTETLEGTEESSTPDSWVEFRKEESSSAQSDEEPRSKLAPQQSRMVPGPVSHTCLFIQTELCKEETLGHWLEKHIENRPRKKVMRFFNQILKAVRYMHTKELIHRDLKPSNIFFSLKKDDVVKIGDFGLVARIDSQDLTPGGHQKRSHGSFAGTPLYMAPEQLEVHNITNKVDVFALGVIFCEFNCPFGTKMEKQKVLGAAREQQFPKTVDDFPLLAGFIKWMLDPNPDTRPSAAEVYKSPKLIELRNSFKTSEIKHVPVV